MTPAERGCDMSLARIFRDLNRADFEYKNGRIDWYQNLWAWIDAYNLPSSLVQTCEHTGKEYGLVKKRGIMCPNIELWPDNYIWHRESRAPVAWVAQSDCRKCPHYLKGEKRGKLRWPRCQLSIDKRKDEQVNTALDAWNSAVKAADDLMKR